MKQKCKRKKTLIYPLIVFSIKVCFMENTIRHNIVQMPSPNKTYILCFLATITKWCQVIAWDKRQYRLDGHYVYLEKLKILGLNEKEIKQKYNYHKPLTN